MRQRRTGSEGGCVDELATTVGKWGAVPLGNSGKIHRTHLRVFPPEGGARTLGCISTSSHLSLTQDHSWGD